MKFLLKLKSLLVVLLFVTNCGSDLKNENISNNRTNSEVDEHTNFTASEAESGFDLSAGKARKQSLKALQGMAKLLKGHDEDIWSDFVQDRNRLLKLFRSIPSEDDLKKARKKLLDYRNIVSDRNKFMGFYNDLLDVADELYGN